MRNNYHRNLLIGLSSLILTLPLLSHADQKLETTPNVIDKLFDKVKSNNNWKKAVATGKHAQVVFMSVSPLTNPKNEIGMETHAFDQVIIIVDGKAKVDLDGKISNVKENDMIFIPEGTAHNVINLEPKKALKLVSVYSENDIPANSIMKQKSSENE